MKKLLIILIVITAITEGCKKYEEGPCFSLRSAKKRLYGTYTLTQYTVNGVDSLNLFNDSLGLSFNFYYSGQSENDVCVIDGLRKDGVETDLTWQWELINKEKVLNIKTSYGIRGTGPFGGNKKPEWNILKLKANNVKLKTNYNNKEYNIELKGD
ncbi:MAG TPA: hypothetical protein PKK00_14500 [Bacteroidales bacterium]|nr:hypothetical protein [Bacteroidales bacterium]HPS18410.1 hypothetical protein [Bacteroidales bacterium]